MAPEAKKPGGVRVKRTTPGTQQRNRGGRSGTIRVSRSRIRRIKIESPTDGSEIEGTPVALRGTAHPGDRLRLEGDGIEPATCKVNSDGSWEMDEFRLPSGAHMLKVVSLDHDGQNATLSIAVSALRPIAVVSPLQGETLEEKRIEVTGKASPDKLVCLRFGHTTLTERADSRGSFRFKDVELTTWGEQRPMLHYAEDPGQGAIELVVYWPGLDLPSLVDPLTRSRLRPGADVVRCSGCYTYCYRATWNRLNRCPRCDLPERFWERPDPKFHTPRVELRSE